MLHLITASTNACVDCVQYGLPSMGQSLIAAATCLPACYLQIALEKGYSQVDWLKLGKTNNDLNGLHGAAPAKGITLAEVAAHNSKEDSWMVLRGRVYNVGPYLRFHPGGGNVMMKVAGKDGTELFNRFHPWVNGDALMEKCLVGWLEVPAVAA